MYFERVWIFFSPTTLSSTKEQKFASSGDFCCGSIRMNYGRTMMIKILLQQNEIIKQWKIMSRYYYWWTKSYTTQNRMNRKKILMDWSKTIYQIVSLAILGLRKANLNQITSDWHRREKTEKLLSLIKIWFISISISRLLEFENSLSFGNICSLDLQCDRD